MIRLVWFELRRVLVCRFAQGNRGGVSDTLRVELSKRVEIVNFDGDLRRHDSYLGFLRGHGPDVTQSALLVHFGA